VKYKAPIEPQGSAIWGSHIQAALLKVVRLMKDLEPTFIRKEMILMANKNYIIVSALTVIISLAGCTSRVDEPDTQSSDQHLETPGIAPETDWDLPDNYETHTDSTGLFSVSFPPG